MITKDSVTVYVNAIMYYKVFANIKSLVLKSQSLAINDDTIRCHQQEDHYKVQVE